MAEPCTQCPRKCGADREKGLGFCGVPWDFCVSRASLHQWEEPPISGTRGSGTVFFAGCNLRCAFCQNRNISHAAHGIRLTDRQLEEVILALQEAGAHNINLVTPTPYALQLAALLRRIKPKLHIPVVYNCGGYELPEVLARLDGLVDIYLPDCKYASNELAVRYSDAPDYFKTAGNALREMLRQVGKPQFDADGMLRKGVLLRHLVLPGARRDSIDLLGKLAERFGASSFLLSLMSQYTPVFAKQSPHRELHRRLTTFEYEQVLQAARQLGFEGYLQDAASASADYTPDFSDAGDFIKKATL